MQSQLSLTTITTLFVNQEISAGPDGVSVKLKGKTHESLPIRNLFCIVGNWIPFSRWNMYGISSKVSKHIFGWFGRRSNIQVQHRIQLEIFNDL